MGTFSNSSKYKKKSGLGSLKSTILRAKTENRPTIYKLLSQAEKMIFFR